jgi:hypothetical protein
MGFEGFWEFFLGFFLWFLRVFGLAETSFGIFQSFIGI